MSMSTLEESTPSLTSRSGSGREIWTVRDDKEPGDHCDQAEQAWHDRCLELEESLASFRDQAHKIREILKEKVGYLLSYMNI